MGQRILIIQGHPDADTEHFGHGLAEAYAEGARESGREVETLSVAMMDFPWLRSPEAFENEEPPESILRAQSAIERASHLVIIYPLWLGDMPAILKAFLEQVFRPGFVTESEAGLGSFGQRRLKGRSVRIVVTMGMPAPFYRLFYRAHSVKSLRRNIFRFCGFKPVRTILIGMAGGNEGRRRGWLERMRRLGRAGR
jgi:putative NADPH-quinone reductase